MLELLNNRKRGIGENMERIPYLLLQSGDYVKNVDEEKQASLRMLLVCKTVLSILIILNVTSSSYLPFFFSFYKSFQVFFDHVPINT